MDTASTLNIALAGRYEIERKLGAGGMATVYRARDVKHDREVAIKVLHPDLGAALGADRFLAEIKTTAKLQHPHILALLDSGSADGLLFYVMPVVSGESLRDRLIRERPLPIPEAIRIAREVASALDYAHRHGVVHRDVKPENILLHDGSALVADFGIALAVQTAGGARMTQTGLSLGTPQYMSPEQAMGERAIDARSDVYALGAVTYEMLLGDPPFSGSSVQTIVAKVMTERPTSLRSLRDTVPVHVEAAVMTALAKLPADRFARAAAFGDALGTPTAAASEWTSTAPRSPADSDSIRRWKRATGISAAVAALALVAALWGWLRPTPAGPVMRSIIVVDSAESISGPGTRVAISPDGMRLLYSGGANPRRIYMKRRDQLISTPIPGSENASSPFFSPDGARIGFVSRATIHVMSLDGTSVLTVPDVRGDATWSPDGYLYAAGTPARGLSRIRADGGGELAPFTTVDTAAGERNHALPSALASGRGVLFSVFYGGRSARGYAVAIADAATGKHRILLENARHARHSPSGHLLFERTDGALLAAPFDDRSMQIAGTPRVLYEKQARDFGVSSSGSLFYTVGFSDDSELVWVSRDGKVQPVDSSFRGVFRDLELSRDGTRVALTIGRQNSPAEIWIKQLDRGPGIRLPSQAMQNQLPAWTGDDRSVTYLSNGPGGAGPSFNDLWTQRADGSAPATLQLHDRRQAGEAIWSPDGRWLIYRSSVTEPGGGDIFAIRPGVDSVGTSLIATRASERSPALSPDGRWMAYASNESGRAEIYVVPFPNARDGKWPVSTNGGDEVRWSRRGDELFYLDREGQMVVTKISTVPRPTIGASTVLFSTRGLSQSPNRSFDVSPDGLRFLMIRPVGGAIVERIVVVDNWFQEAKTITGSR